jgi:hypothetical protein
MTATTTSRILGVGGRTSGRDRAGRGIFVDYQGVWFGIAVLALLGACLQIWRERRAFNRLPQVRVVQQAALTTDDGSPRPSDL